MWTGRTEVTSNWRNRGWDNKFLVTQDLDFLMTEANDYIVLQDSYGLVGNWTWRTTVTSNWQGRPTI
jgi:hypothetical protein